MPVYLVTANCSVELVFSVEAESREAATSIVDSSIGVSGRLFDLPDSAYIVVEDNITEMHSLKADLE